MLEITCIMVLQDDNNFDDITNITNFDYLCKLGITYLQQEASRQSGFVWPEVSSGQARTQSPLLT